MIQIIGFLICACLAVKLLEMSGNAALQDESGNPRGSIIAALIVGWASVFGFTLWLLVQGEAFPRQSSREDVVRAIEDQSRQLGTDREPLTQEQIDCINRNTGDMDAVLACAS